MDARIAAKKQLRKELTALARQISASKIDEESCKVTEKVLKSDWLQDANKISVYVSTIGEIDTSALIKNLLQLNKRVYIPYFKKGVNCMEMYQLKDLNEYNQLEATLWGIKQHINPDEEMSWRKSGGLDLVLMPGVAFTKDGRRLGHGKGFYDRFLHEHQQLFGQMPHRVALSLQYQLLDDVPVTDNDVPLDSVIVS